MQGYRAHFSGWYWVYPALELSRPIWGDRWIVETKVTYSMIDGLNGRGFYFMIFFNPARDRESALLITRGKDIGPQDNTLMVKLTDYGSDIAANDLCVSPRDTAGSRDFTYWYRVIRRGVQIAVFISEDDTTYREVLTGNLPSDLRNVPQFLAISGESWFLPAGSYADWDYIRFRLLPD
jgi:hypothetical protein